MSVRLQFASFVMAIALCASARADDWLAVLPACQERVAMEASFALVYPSDSLPGVVVAGDFLMARVRVPAALTPPPGVQQERALSGWSAELIGGGIELAGRPIAHRHNLPVVAIRPDSGASLLYLVRLAVPAYAAPGSYALVLRTPFGDRRVEHAVAVLAPTRLPLLAAAPSQFVAERELSSSPVDVFIDRSGTSTWLARPRLAVGATSIALRVGNELWTSAPCPAAQERFEDEVRELLRSERRTRVDLERMALPPSAASEVAMLELAASGLRLDNRHGSLDRRVLVLAPGDRAIRVRDAELALYPASDLGARRPLGVAIELHVHAGADGRLELAAADAARALALEPELAESGADTLLRVRGLAEAPGTRVAFEYGFARTALTGSSLRARFPGPLEVPLRALVLRPERGAQLVRGQLIVGPRRPPSCSPRLGAAPAGDSWALLFALGFLLKRRVRAGAGNRIRVERRCQLRDRPSHVQKPR